jgi:hypothetical protein
MRLVGNAASQRAELPRFLAQPLHSHRHYRKGLSIRQRVRDLAAPAGPFGDQRPSYRPAATDRATRRLPQMDGRTRLLAARRGWGSRNARRLRLKTNRAHYLAVGLNTQANLDHVLSVSQMSNSNRGLGAHWRGLPRFGRRGFYRTLRINLAFAELAGWHFKMSSTHLLCVNKPIYDLHALDTHL